MTSSKALQTFASIGVDIGKEMFHIVGFSVDGKIVLDTPCASSRAQTKSQD